MSDNIVKLVAKEGDTSKKEVIDFLQDIIEDVESGKSKPFDGLLVLGHTWDEDKDGFTLYRSRLRMSALESLSIIELAKTLFISDIMN